MLGKRSLDKMLEYSFFIFEALIIIVLVLILNGGPNVNLYIIGIVGLIGIYALVFISVYNYVLRKAQQRFGGKKVLDGFLDGREGEGEEYEMIIASINPYRKLSENERLLIDKFIKIQLETLKDVEDNAFEILNKVINLIPGR